MNWQHRFRFSIRTMMVLVLFLCIGLSYCAYQIAVYREREKTVLHLLSCGGRSARVFYDYDMDLKRKWIDGNHTPPGPDCLRRILGQNFFADVVLIAPGSCPHVPLSRLKIFPSLEYLYVRGRRVCPNDLKVIAGLEQLHYLELAETSVDDTGLRILSSARSLNGLWLDHTDVCDGSSLAALSDLVELDLSGTRIRDLSFVAHLQKLRTLKLADTQVDDINALSATSLTEVDLSGTRICDLSPLESIGTLEYVAVADLIDCEAEVERFKQAMPDCVVEP